MTPDGDMSGQPAKAGMEVPVPLEVLAMPGQNEEMNNPSVGDPVQMMAEGKVTRIEGQMAYVSIDSVNGKPVSESGAQITNTPEKQPGQDDEYAQLRSEAGQQGAM